jgi:hypothetical protein
MMPCGLQNIAVEKSGVSRASVIKAAFAHEQQFLLLLLLIFSSSNHPQKIMGATGCMQIQEIVTTGKLSKLEHYETDEKVFWIFLWKLQSHIAHTFFLFYLYSSTWRWCLACLHHIYSLALSTFN